MGGRITSQLARLFSAALMDIAGRRGELHLVFLRQGVYGQRANHNRHTGGKSDGLHIAILRLPKKLLNRERVPARST
jgi:hypothetical protein